MQYIYTMIGVSKIVPPKRSIIKDISLSFYPGAKIGLLGVNGSGKSTVLRIMAGVDTEYNGEARPQPGIKIGFLAQEPMLDPEKTVRESVEEGVSHITDAQAQLDDLAGRHGEAVAREAGRHLLRRGRERRPGLQRVRGRPRPCGKRRAVQRLRA